MDQICWHASHFHSPDYNVEVEALNPIPVLRIVCSFCLIYLGELCSASDLCNLQCTFFPVYASDTCCVSSERCSNEEHEILGANDSVLLGNGNEEV